MSSFTYRTKDGHRRCCTCYRSECSIECGLYREYTGIKTNYDCLISKTPEELAEWLRNVITECSRCPCNETPVLCEKPCKECLFDWLKAPADKEESHASD